ncbi:hypothetical protein evm_009714 [Chilo suppressalis]|nr:hypothetical protein evm_009714 [Chilo suppressalis]
MALATVPKYRKLAKNKQQANRANLSLTFAQQVARCGRGRREKERECVIPENYPLEKDSKLRSYIGGERDCSSPLYASPPHSPTELCSPTQQNNTFGSQPPSLTSIQPILTDTHFNRDTHMRIILGRDSKPADRNDSAVSKGRLAYNRLMGTIGRTSGKIFKKTKSKRNGIVTNPAMRLVHNVRNGLDSAAANIRRTGVALAASASSANPAVKTNAFQWRKETPL